MAKVAVILIYFQSSPTIPNHIAVVLWSFINQYISTWIYDYITRKYVRDALNDYYVQCESELLNYQKYWIKIELKYHPNLKTYASEILSNKISIVTTFAQTIVLLYNLPSDRYIMIIIIPIYLIILVLKIRYVGARITDEEISLSDQIHSEEWNIRESY